MPHQDDKRLKVLFVEPPKEQWFVMGGYLPPPYGIIQLAAFLEKTVKDLEVEVLDLSPERCRVALSLKRLQTNPWISIGADLTATRAVPAVITSVLSYGAFARLECGVEGLIHVSEVPLAEGQSVRDVLREGQSVQVRVMHVDVAHQRMGLSMKLDAG